MTSYTGSSFVYTITPFQIWALLGAWSIASNRHTNVPVSNTELKKVKKKTHLKSLYSFHFKNKIDETLEKEHLIPNKILEYTCMLKAEVWMPASGKLTSNKET